ncbi:MAG: FAD-dependent oxidoreductase [Rhodospirillales bacterium]|nr:FAD-dependent oxidoreductase [Rhodospirillales bacterium]
MPGIVIVGGGQAGGHAAVAAREAGYDGPITLIGAEAHIPYERPPLSKEALLAQTLPAPKLFFPPEKLAQRGITTLTGVRVEAIRAATRDVVLAGGQTLAWEKLLIATGGRARALAVPGGDRALLLRTYEDAQAIRARLVSGARVVCIGAGVIGLEIASSARARGCDVTVIEAADGVMGRVLSAPLAAFMHERHEAAGVHVRLGAAVHALEPGRVICDGFEVAADVVIAGIGIVRETTLAESAGIVCAGAIPVDETTATGVPGIFAAGDVAAFVHPLFGRRMVLETWRHAQNHGIAAGRTMAGKPEPYDDVPWFWTDQLGLNLQVAGMPREGVRTVWRGELGAASFTAFHLDEAGCLVGAEGVGAAREIRAAQTLIKARKPVDAALLADTSVAAQKLAMAVR